VDGTPAQTSVSFDVFKAEGTNITDVSSRVLAKLNELQQPGGELEGVQVLVMFDRGTLLVDDLSVLIESGIETMVLVLLVLMLTVGVRESIIAAISVPLSFVVAFIGIYYSGNTINFVSLFALILSIGILVDSSIVIIDAINRQLLDMDHPADETPSQRLRVKVQAALNAISDFHAPLTSGTLTTVAVFVPLFLISGVTGEFIASIPFTTLFVLTASLVVALGFVPLIASRFLKRGHTESTLDTWRTRIVDRMRTEYRAYLQRVLTERPLQYTFVTTLIVLFVFSLSLPAIGAVRTVFFESSDADYIFAEVEMPPGTRLEQTLAQTEQVEQLLYNIPEIESFVTTVGSTSQFSSGGTGGASSSEKYANIFISLRKDRARTSADIIEQERPKFESINTAIVRFSELEDGPPSAAPVGVTLRSESLNDLDTAARIMTHALQETPGTSDITNSITEPPVEYVIAIDRARAAAAGILPANIALSVRTALYGNTATELREVDKNVDVVVQSAVGTGTDARQLTEGSIESVQTIPITSTTGQLVPLSSVASVQVQAGRESIVHKDGDRIATVSSRLAEGGNAVVITQELQNKLPTLGLPASVSVSFGGESEDVDQSFRDMFVALFLGLVGMFGILLLEFDSIRHAGYVLLTVPLALIGVFIGLMMTGSPLSFPSMMGFIALAGIVVNNAIILIDVFNTERAKLTEQQETPEKLQEIVLEGSVSRLRPVLLTAVTTVIGTLPLLWAAEIWVPLVYAMVFGLIFATVITLVFIPVLYVRYPGSVTRL
jgi:HAE1 family hydrophobic/amphiphilic exporter-1